MLSFPALFSVMVSSALSYGTQRQAHVLHLEGLHDDAMYGN